MRRASARQFARDHVRSKSTLGPSPCRSPRARAAGRSLAPPRVQRLDDSPWAAVFTVRVRRRAQDVAHGELPSGVGPAPTCRAAFKNASATRVAIAFSFRFPFALELCDELAVVAGPSW